MPDIFLPPSTLSGNNIKRLEYDIGRYKEALSREDFQGKYSEMKNITAFIEGEVDLASLESQVTANISVLLFQQTASQQLQALSSVNNRLNLLLRQTLNSNPHPPVGFKEEVTMMLQEVTSILNQRTGKETTLGGTNTLSDVTVDLTKLDTIQSGSTRDISYYLGNDETSSLNLSISRSIDLFNVNATHPSIEKTIRALRLCLKGNPNDPQNIDLNYALDISTEAQSDFPIAITLLGLSINHVKDVEQEGDKAQLTIIEFLSKIGAEDKKEALIKVLELESILDISFHLALKTQQDLDKFLDRVG